MALTLDNPYTSAGVDFGTSVEIVEVNEVIHNSTLYATLQFEPAAEGLPFRRINVLVWNEENYPGFGQWTVSDLEARIEEVLS